MFHLYYTSLSTFFLLYYCGCHITAVNNHITVLLGRLLWICLAFLSICLLSYSYFMRASHCNSDKTVQMLPAENACFAKKRPVCYRFLIFIKSSNSQCSDAPEHVHNIVTVHPCSDIQRMVKI